jgi:hypothetical protein
MKNEILTEKIENLENQIEVRAKEDNKKQKVK